jgi:hypothetical protein
MTLTRRRWLADTTAGIGAAGLSPLLQPLLARAVAEARGDAPPQRFVFVVPSSGITPAELVPPSLASGAIVPSVQPNWPDDLKPTEKLIDQPLESLQLSPALAALEPHKRRVNIVQGLSGRMCKGGHSSWYGALGCFRTGGEHNTGRPISATIDGLLSELRPGIFPHVGLTLGGKVMEAGNAIKDTVVYPGISASAADRPLPFQGSPLAAFRDLFGVAATDAESQTKLALQSMLLDFMVDDVKRLEKQIAGAEKEKLARYLEGFESLRDRGRKLRGIEAEVRRHAPEVSDKYKSKVETDRIDAHFDVAAAALIGGLTNVVTLRVDTLSIVYRGLGIGRDVHGLGHGEGPDGMSPVEARRRILTFHVDQIARLAAKLAAVPEADGTMLDHTLIVLVSDAAEKHHSGCYEWPLVTVGGAGRRFRPAGRYLQFPGYQKPGHRTIAGFYTTLLHAVGHEAEQFGQLDPNLDKKMQRGPLAELGA